MKTSYNWLKEFIDIPWTVRDLATELTMVGLEVEAIESIGDLPPTIVVAEILSREKHPNADTLSVCQVSTGTGDPLQVVCGAPNCLPGRKVALAQIGTQFGDVVIAERAVRRVVSRGMLCSERELGLGDDHSGIMILPDAAGVGAPVRDLTGVDHVIDWEVTPNRPDWLSHLGIAREIGAVTRTRLRYPKADLAACTADVAPDVTVRVECPLLCPRYTARILRGVTIGSSPEWLQRRLRAVGLRPINNVVDITNYVLMEVGQPLHAFDLRFLEQATIIVRTAVPGESFHALDGSEHELGASHVVIADAAKAVALGGIIGGDNSQIAADTTDILLESACFDPVNIRMTARQLGLATDSSYRFERGVDPNLAGIASARAARLICELAGGRVCGDMIDLHPSAPSPLVVSCRCDRVRQLLGVPLEDAEIHAILENLGLARVDESGQAGTSWRIPSHRQDLTREVDLIEEVARMHGLNNIPSGGAVIRMCAELNQDAYRLVQEAREQLLAFGFVECMNYTLESESDALSGGDIAADDLFLLKNPLSNECTVLKPTLIPGMLRSLARNIARGNLDLRLMEFGRVFSRTEKDREEHDEVCLALTGRRNPEQHSSERMVAFDFYDLRGYVEDWLTARGVQAVFRKGTHSAFEDGVCADVLIGSSKVGTIGAVRRGLLKEIRIAMPVYMGLFDLSAVLACSHPATEFRPPPMFPAITRDVVFSAAEDLTHCEVTAAIGRTGAAHLESTQLLEIYRDEQQIGKGRKSMAYSLTFRSPDRTLTDDEVNLTQEQIRRDLIKHLPIQIR